MTTALPPPSPISGTGLTVNISKQQCQLVAIAVATTCANISQERLPNEMARTARTCIGEHIAAEQRERISEFSSGAPPFLLIRGAIPTEGLPPTPLDDAAPKEASWRLQAAILLGYLKLCGSNALSFRDEMGGRLFHMVMPAQNSERSRDRSTKALHFHTEVVNGYFREESPSPGSPLAPDKFALACLRNPSSVPTTVLPLANVLQRMHPDSVSQLQRNEYIARSQSSFDREVVIDEVPVLVRLLNGELGIRYSHSKLDAKNSRASIALQELRDTISKFDISSSVVLAPGDVLILNNRLCLHGRGDVSTTSRFDGNDRWLLRLYGYEDDTLPYLQTDQAEHHVMQIAA